MKFRRSRFRAGSFRSSDVDEIVAARVGIDARISVYKLLDVADVNGGGGDVGDVVVRRDAVAELLQVLFNLFQLPREVALKRRRPVDADPEN